MIYGTVLYCFCLLFKARSLAASTSIIRTHGGKNFFRGDIRRRGCRRRRYRRHGRRRRKRGGWNPADGWKSSRHSREPAVRIDVGIGRRRMLRVKPER